MRRSIIAFEGIDGSGKTSLIKIICKKLIENGYSAKAISTIEEEDKEAYELAMRQFVPTIHTPEAMFFYQALHARKARRAQEYAAEGNIVLCDRWDMSFYVSHENFGFMSSEDVDVLNHVSRLAFNGLKPDLGIYLDVSIDTAIDRRMWRKDSIADVELEKQKYRKVLATYKRLVKRDKWLKIDANQPFSKVLEQVWKLVLTRVQHSPNPPS